MRGEQSPHPSPAPYFSLLTSHAHHDRSPRPLRPFPDRLPPRRRRPHRALQLALRPAYRRHSSSCASRTPTGSAAPRSTPGSSSTGSPGSASPGTRARSSRASTRARHQADAERLLAEGKAYRCFCTREELDAQRAEAEAAGGGFRYDRRCYRLARRGGRSDGSAPGLRPPSGSCCRTRRSPGTTRCTAGSASRDATSTTSSSCGATTPPIYNLAVVSDDIAMRITHVIRGRRPHLQHAEADRALPRARPRAAGLRARADDPGHGREEALQAARRHRGGRLSGAGHLPRRDAELPRAARLVARRRPRDPARGRR